MVNKPLMRPYFLGGVALGGGVARIPMKSCWIFPKHSVILGMFYVFLEDRKIWVFPKIGGFYPQIIHLYIGFSMKIHHPFWGFTTPILGLTPIYTISSSKGSCPAAQRVFQEQIDHLCVGLGQRVGQGVPKKKSLHPGKIRWNPKMEVWKMMFLFNRVIFWFQGCNINHQST